MRDGVKLAASIVRPDTEERVPTVLVRTPYLRAGEILLREGFWPARGYALVVQDVRGRFASEGRFHPFVHEAADGERAVHWLAEQPWCDGRVAVAGFSYVAFSA